MKRTTRKLILNVATGVAIAATAAVMLIPAAASAAPATATANVNVRSGPGSNFGVVDLLRSGQVVDVGECRGSWCQVTARGINGWVSSSYLTAAGGNGGTQVIGPVNPGVGISVGPGGVSIGVGNSPPPPVANPNPPRPGPGAGPVPPRPGPGAGPTPPRPGPGYDPRPTRPRISQACFYDRTNFSGASFCLQPGDANRSLGSWADRISSIDNPDNLNITVCYEVNFRNCRTYTSSASRLGNFDDSIRSVQVR